MYPASHTLRPRLCLRKTTPFTVHQNFLAALLELSIIPGLGEELANVVVGPRLTTRGAVGVFNGSCNVGLETADTCRLATLSAGYRLAMDLFGVWFHANVTRRLFFFFLRAGHFISFKGCPGIAL